MGMKQVDVVSFMICRNGKILAEKRKLAKETDPGKVALHGRHVERGDSFEQACRRELKEEFGIGCSSFKFIIRSLHHTAI